MKRYFQLPSAMLLDEPGDRMVKRFAKNAFVICPIFTLIFTFAFGDHLHDFLIHWSFSYVISFVVSGFCHFFVWAVVGCENFFLRRRGLIPLPPGRARIYLLSAAGLVPGIYLAFRTAETLFTRLGHPIHVGAIEDYGQGFIIGTMILGMIIVAEMHRDAQDAEKANQLKVAQLERERLHAQISALTAQMNPHLLFNSLNTIASMIPSNPEKAEEMTVLLSDLYRGVLNSSRHSTHSLATELGICRNYLSVEKARHGDRLDFSIDDSLGAQLESIEIPVLTLQPLVENAVKHGIAPRSSGGRISLSVGTNEESLQLLVEDDGVGFGNSSSRAGAGIGIENCRERLRLHYGSESRMEIGERTGGGTFVRIEIPRTPIGVPPGAFQ